MNACLFKFERQIYNYINWLMTASIIEQQCLHFDYEMLALILIYN